MSTLWLYALFALWQYRAAGVSGQVPLSADADAMTDALRLGKPAQREDLLRRLGVQAETAHEAASSVEQSGLRVEQLGGAEILFVPCDFPLREAHLYLLRPQEGRWRAVDDVGLDCWWKPSSYEVVQVLNHPDMLLLAHHINVAHGTGLVRDEMKLLTIRGDHWATVLTTTEYESEDPAGEDLRVEQAATLQPFPDGSVEETRATTRHRSSPEQQTFHLERRHWQWNPATKVFTAGRFAPAK